MIRQSRLLEHVGGIGTHKRAGAEEPLGKLARIYLSLFRLGQTCPISYNIAPSQLVGAEFKSYSSV